MPSVQTVLGPVDVERLGTTLAHEHLWTKHESVFYQFPHLYDVDTARAKIIDAVLAARSAGLRTYCDATVMGLGRDARFMQEVSRHTGVHVVAGTGLYTFDAVPPYFAGRDVDVLADAFVHDITVGIQATAARAAFIKCATDAPGVTTGVEKVLRATARAHAATGAPIMTHASATDRRGLDQIAIFDQESVRPSAVIIGHCGDTDDLGYLDELLRWGATLGMDRYGMDDRLTFERRQRTIVDLCERGHGERLVLSQDHSIVRDVTYPASVLDQRAGWTTSFVLDTVVPDLQRRGLPEAVARAMVSTNVHRWLGSGEPAGDEPGGSTAPAEVAAADG